MKKLVAMFALGLTIVGTSYAQNVPQRERDTQDSRYGQERKERKDKGDFGRDDDRRNKLTAAQRATQRTEMLSQRLDLSSKQQKKLQELNLKQARQMESLASRNNNSDQRNNNQRQEMQKLRASWEKEFKGIVSKKQYAKYEEDRKQMQAQRANRANRQGENNTRSRRPANS